MHQRMWRKVFDVLFWLGLSVYVGGMVAVGAIVAPSVFATARDSSLTMPANLAPAPLEMDRQVGGQIFGDILDRFAYVEYASTALLLIAVMGMILARVRLARVLLVLWFVLALLLAYDALYLRPAVKAQRELVRGTAIHHTLSETIPWPEREAFDALHKRSEAVGSAKVYVLLALLLAGVLRPMVVKPSAKSLKPSRG
jgi:hypothetical protein